MKNHISSVTCIYSGILGACSGVHRGALRMVVLALSSVLACFSALAPLPAHALTVMEGGDGLAQSVDESERVVRGQRVTISAGHLDMGPKLVNGSWELLIRDDSAQPAVWRDTKDVIIRVSDKAKMPAPSGEKYSFLPSRAGQDVYVVPQVQAAGVVWIGWNTQDPAIVKTLDRGANLRLTGVRGSGDMALFLQDGAFGDPLPMWDSRTRKPQDVWMEANTHVHANWVFTQPGAYTAAIQVVGKDKNHQEHDAHATLRFAVGDSVTDDAVRQAPEPDNATNSAASHQASGEQAHGGDAVQSHGGAQQASDNASANRENAFSVTSIVITALVIMGALLVLGVLAWRHRRAARLSREALAEAQAQTAEGEAA
ncbi:MAG: choice-of-anchor M domain-containing protein [Actinomycetaceae bacterium]|nr:choice-of-anchor M domain-containing protein [Actinomycetaceae bacterium]MDY6082311.1 choice-of-anchor M domain-containing protein [Actinomycetaceae bacterium]